MPLVLPVATQHSPETLAATLPRRPGLVVLRSSLFDPARARFSYVTANPFLRFRCWGSRCQFTTFGRQWEQFGNPWSILDQWMARFELPDQVDLPFPLGGCFGYWGYDLKNSIEPHLRRTAVNDLELADADLGFYDSLVVFDHLLNRVHVVSTGVELDGSRRTARAYAQADYWRRRLEEPGASLATPPPPGGASLVCSSMARDQFIDAVRQAQHWIRHGHIYQVNLSHRLTTAAADPWTFYSHLLERSPAPFSAYLDAGDLQIISTSPELFLRLSGSAAVTRPIKGTRPRGADVLRDAQLAYELQTSPKETAELVMITDLLRNDLGRVCEFGSVTVPELARLERYSHVQHLVSTIEGHLRRGTTHFQALASCFPGGSITGAPKIRAMEIIDELEPVARGPYTGALGYLGFNRESQLSIAIRIAIVKEAQVHFHAGAGIVADSDPAAEYDETLSKIRAFLNLLGAEGETSIPPWPEPGIRQRLPNP
jgi:para-aminobenzoate synthetase component 1